MVLGKKKWLFSIGNGAEIRPLEKGRNGYFCHLLITFENSLKPVQDQHSVGPDLDPNCLLK